MPFFSSTIGSTIGSTMRQVRDFFNRDVNVPPLQNIDQGFLVPAELKPLLEISEAERARQRQVLKARLFHEGDHGVQLTPRLEEFLGSEPDDAPCLNVTRTVTMAVVERIGVERFESDATDEAEKKKQEAFASELWESSQMKAKEGELWEMVDRDGEAFLFYEWNPEGNDGAGEVEMIPHQRYTDPRVSYEGTCGDGLGMWFEYPGGDSNRKPLRAIKRSTESVIGETGEVESQERLDIHEPGLLRKYYKAKSGWMPLYEPTLEHPEGVWPIVRVNARGKPLGIPIVHVKNPFLRPEAKDVLRLQRPLDKLFLDFLVSGDQTAFRILKYFGWLPEDGEGNPLRVEPGAWIGSPEPVSKDEQPPVFEAIDGPDLEPGMKAIDRVIGWVAMTSDTPTSRFQVTGNVARAETIDAQDGPLKFKVERRTSGYAIALEAGLRIGRELKNLYGLAMLDERPRFATVWKPFEAPSTAQKKEESEAMQVAGFTPQEIQEDVWNKAPGSGPKPQPAKPNPKPEPPADE